jgi:hypothetical protein
MAKVQATHLGGILITKIPAHGQVKTHHDRGTWHSGILSRKVYVPLKANDRCVNHCGDESVVMNRGDGVVVRQPWSTTASSMTATPTA